VARITWCGGDHDGHREAAHTTASRRGSNGHGIGLLVSDAESVSSIQGADGPRLGSQNRTEASVPCHLIIASNGISPARDISRIAKAIPGCLVCPQIQCRGQFIRRYCRVRLHELLPERVWCRNSADVRHAALRSHERGIRKADFSTRPGGLEPPTPGLGNRCWPRPMGLERPSHHKTPTNDRLATGYSPTVEGALLGAPPDGVLLPRADHSVARNRGSNPLGVIHLRTSASR